MKNKKRKKLMGSRRVSGRLYDYDDFVDDHNADSVDKEVE